MRQQALTALTAGINRQRVKGGADPGSLYDLLNAYVTISGTIVSRPGTKQDAAIPAGTKGLTAFDNKLVVFSNSAKTVPSGYDCEIVIHPTDAAQAVSYIHFAEPFLRYLYVVVEFADGAVFHYWLQRRAAWTADTSYDLGDLVEPTVRNGYAYKATRLGGPSQVWAPNVDRAVGDKVEPTTPSGYVHTVTSVLGAQPRSGATEPAWATSDGGQTIEDTDLSITPPPTTGTTTPPTTLPTDVTDRYGNMAGGFRTNLK